MQCISCIMPSHMSPFLRYIGPVGVPDSVPQNGHGRRRTRRGRSTPLDSSCFIVLPVVMTCYFSGVFTPYPRGACAVAFAKETRTSPWQAFGAHQHPSTFPRNSGNAVMRCGCVSIHSRYFWITASLSPSFPISNGFPHLDGRPIYTSCFARLQ
jgi:hypothetical protein